MKSIEVEINRPRKVEPVAIVATQTERFLPNGEVIWPPQPLYQLASGELHIPWYDLSNGDRHMKLFL